MAEQRWRLDLEYDGAGFAGWQLQPGQRTVQGELEAALAVVLQHPVRVSVAGRTDAGVHAQRQVVSFTTHAVRQERALLGGVNALLDDDVAILAAQPVPMDFDPRRWSWGKHYRYRWLVRSAPSPLRRGRVWHWRKGLDVEAMHAGAQLLVGRNDLSSFRATGCTATHPVRVVESLEVRREGDEVWLDARGQGFLRHTVRIIAGSLHEVGRGRRRPEWIGEVLAARDRSLAGMTAPAGGLSLLEVRYGEGPPPWHRGNDAEE